MPKTNSKGQKVSKDEQLINQFNAKIKEVERLRPDIAEIQPLVRSAHYFERFKNLTPREKTRARKVMQDYLREGSEERSEKYPNMTKWGAESSDKFVKQTNRQKAKYYKSPYLKDIDKMGLKPQFEYMNAEQAKRAVYALEKQTESDIHMTAAQYKENYLKAVENEMGRGGLYTYVSELPEEILVAAYYSDPATFEIKFVYSQDEKVAQQRYLLEQFESYVSSYSNWKYENPFEAEDEFMI
jgi:hypothetical protein